VTPPISIAPLPARRRRRSITWFAWGFLTLGLTGWLPLGAANFEEYQVKAAILHSLSTFVDWPTNSFASATSPFVIGVLGRDPFGPLLPKILNTKQIHHRPIVIQLLGKDDDPTRCHLLFISASEKDRLRSLLDKLKNAPVLTVGDSASYCAAGVMINLQVVEKNGEEKIAFEMNHEAARHAGLQVSSQLLRLATKIHGPERPAPPPGAPPGPTSGPIPSSPDFELTRAPHDPPGLIASAPQGPT